MLNCRLLDSFPPNRPNSNLPVWRNIPNLPSLRDLPTTNGNHCTGDGIKVLV